MKILSFLVLFSIFISCNQNDKKIDSEKIVKKEGIDRLAGFEEDTIYTREWMDIDYGNKRTEEVEVYISENNDTVVNQYKALYDNKIDTVKSQYYDLKITETNKPHIYDAQITFHTKYQDLKLDTHNRRTIEFSYCDQNKDSIFIRYVKSKTNKINFKFENFYGKRLHGQLFQMVERDTVVNKEKKINLHVLYVMVDNYAKTSNLFIDQRFIKENRFNQKKVKITQK